MRVGPFISTEASPRRLGARPWLIGAAVLALVTAGAGAWAFAAPSRVPEETVAIQLEAKPVLELPPLRDYPTVLPEDAWPERPPFTMVRGFPPAPKPPPMVSVGPVRRFFMPRFEVDSPIEVLSITPSNELPTPNDAMYRVGWYTDFGQPGAGGNSVFSAHETWNHYQAPFFHLAKAELGDEVAIDMADGRRLVYSVISNTRYEVTSIPMAAILWPPQRGADEWITLITCGGRIVYDERTGFGEYLDRDVVVARRVR